MRLVLLGPPGSGKGTQAKLLAARLGMAHISTGDILREAVRTGTALGRQVRPFMERGTYVPDELVSALVRERLSRDDAPKHFLLDGYPRTRAQAEALDRLLAEIGLALDAVVYLDVPDEIIVHRITGRRVCPACGAVYHVENQAPRQAGICDGCGAELIQREDDREETVRERLRVFRQTVPEVVAYYAHQGNLLTVDGSADVDTVHQALCDKLQEVTPGC